MNRLHDWLARHPLVRDAILFCIPALLFGAALRLILLYYSPLAFWNADSRSFMGFTNGVLTEWYFSINEKRRYLYPIFMLPISLLPGGTLRWLSWIQAAVGLLTVLPLAYIVRRVFTGWKWWIIPVTVLYAGMPVLIWYEHELLADTLTFNYTVWIMAGWVAWTSQKNPVRARQLWWWFFVPFAMFLLTKPSGKFLWPGLAIGILLVLGWRVLRWPQWAAIGALFLVSLTIGDEDQSSWLLYTSNFPLTRLDTPLHAEYKAEIKDWVQKTRDELDDYHRTEMDVHDFLRSPEDHPEYPLWQKLAKESDEKLNNLYHDLSKEALSSSPHLFLYIALTRLAGSANQTDFDTDRFETSYYDQRFEKQYGSKRNTPSMLRIALGIPKDEPMPPYSTVRTWINPHPDFAGARFLVAYSDAYQRAGDLIYRPRGKPSTMLESRPSVLGWWVVIGTIMSLFSPWRNTLGVWAIALWGYGLAVFLLGVELHRYFTPLWALILLLLAIPLDGIYRLVLRRFS